MTWDPRMSEWGNPPGGSPAHGGIVVGERRELKHLITGRKRK